MKNEQNKHNVKFLPFYQIAQLAFELGRVWKSLGIYLKMYNFLDRIFSMPDSQTSSIFKINL